MNETSSINGWTLGSERPSRHAVALTRDAGITAETRLALRLCLLLFFLLTINLVSNSNICKFVFHCPCFGNPNPDHCFLQCCVTIQFAGVWLRDISNGMLCGRETWANGLRAAVPTRNGYPLLCSGQGYATALALIVSRFVAMIFVDFFQLIEPPPPKAHHILLWFWICSAYRFGHCTFSALKSNRQGMSPTMMSVSSIAYWMQASASFVTQVHTKSFARCLMNNFRTVTHPF